jgi:hypothetical protein
VTARDEVGLGLGWNLVTARDEVGLRLGWNLVTARDEVATGRKGECGGRRGMPVQGLQASDTERGRHRQAPPARTTPERACQRVGRRKGER